MLAPGGESGILDLSGNLDASPPYCVPGRLERPPYLKKRQQQDKEGGLIWQHT